MTQQIDTQAPYDREAEFQREERHLGEVVDWMDRRIADAEKPRVVIEGDVQAADKVVEMDAHRLQELKDNRPRPYFGRIDYTAGSSGEVKTAYIGNFSSGVSGTPDNLDIPIAHRNTPIARLYYDPAGNSHGESMVYLVRMLAIEDAVLLKIDDVLRLVAPSEFSQSSQILDEKLSAASEGDLSAIVQTIQPEQYKAIAATTSRVLIVQGAAGSGKSDIGLHRIDYILWPESDIGEQERPIAQRIIMFGPSPAFLQYVSGLLPGLGVEGVRQSTVSQWMLGQFSARVTMRRNDPLLDTLMNNRRRLSDAEIEAHQFKGSMKMKRLLDGYVRHLVQDLRNRVQNIRGRTPMGLSSDEFNNKFEEAIKAHPQPNAARANLIEGLANHYADSVARPNRPGRMARRGESRFDLRAQGRRQAENALTLWPRYDFRTEYATLMSNPDKILEFSGKDAIDLSDAVEISQTAPPTQAGQTLGMTDIAAALYLDYALNGFESERFQHIVVDEAQDVSPLELAIMRMHSVNDSFTILGDIRQSILPYKSNKNWQPIVNVFRQEQRVEVSSVQSRLTYRSARQITQYANRILQGLPQRTRMPIPHTRNGDRPKLVCSQSAADMRLEIARSVQELRQKDNVRLIAILTKWRQTTRDIIKFLEAAEIPDVSEFQAGGIRETDIIVSPIILTKGLEFDAVIVANASKNNFDETEFDRMLLYLACTRARHYLQIHWHGARSAKSPIVPDTSRLAR